MMTSLPSSLCGWSNLLITGALIRLLLSWKASAILNHYNLPTFSLSSITEQWHQDLACENNRLILFYTACLGAGNGYMLSDTSQHVHFLTSHPTTHQVASFLHQISNSSVCCDFLRCLCLSVSMSERLHEILLHTHLAAVCATCAFSQQVIANRNHLLANSRGSRMTTAGQHTLWNKGKGCWVSVVENAVGREYVEKNACFLLA